MDDTVAGQADFSGDVQQKETESETEKETDDGAADQGKQDDHEQALKRKSDAEWQQNAEKAQKYDKLFEALGVSKADAKEKDPVELLKERVEKAEKRAFDAEERGLRRDFEREIPATQSEKYKEQWDTICKDRKDADHKYHKLSYQELWNVIRRDDPKVKEAKKELEKSEKNPFEGSVPMGGSQSQEVDPSLQSEAQALMVEELGYSKEDFKS